MALLNSPIFLVLLASFGCQNVWSAPCSQEKLMPCLSKMSSLMGMDQENLDPSTLGNMCKTVADFIKCLDELPCEVPEQVRAQKEAMTEKIAPLCSDDGCSIMNMGTCMAPWQSMGEESQNMEKMCPVVAEAEKCLSDLSSKCKGETKKQVDETLAGMKQYTAVCGNTQGGCSPEDMQKCGKGLAAIGGGPTKMCETVKVARKCFKEISSKCSGDMKTHIDTALKQFESLSDECCDAITKMSTVCYPMAKDQQDEFDSNDKTQCMDNARALSCLKMFNPKCDGLTGPMKQGMDEGVGNMTSRFATCEKNGYNVSSVKYTGSDPNNSGLLLHPAIAVLVSALMMGLATLLLQRSA